MNTLQLRSFARHNHYDPGGMDGWDAIDLVLFSKMVLMSNIMSRIMSGFDVEQVLRKKLD